MPPDPRPQDVVGVLLQQHDTIRDLLGRVSDADGAERRSLLEELHRQVQIQFIVEENILHPIHREHVGGLQAEVLVAEAHLRHGLVDRTFLDLYGQDPASTEWSFKVAVMREALERHLDEQRDEMIPALKACCSQETLVELARPIVSKRRALEQARQGTAHSPSW